MAEPPDGETSRGLSLGGGAVTGQALRAARDAAVVVVVAQIPRFERAQPATTAPAVDGAECNLACPLGSEAFVGLAVAALCGAALVGGAGAGWGFY